MKPASFGRNSFWKVPEICFARERVLLFDNRSLYQTYTVTTRNSLASIKPNHNGKTNAVRTEIDLKKTHGENSSLEHRKPRVAHLFSLAYRYLKSCLSAHDKNAELVLRQSWFQAECIYTVYDGSGEGSQALFAMNPPMPLAHKRNIELAYLGALRFRFPEQYASLIESIPDLKTWDIWGPAIRYFLNTRESVSAALAALIHRCNFVSEERRESTKGNETIHTTILTLHLLQTFTVSHSGKTIEIARYHAYQKALQHLEPTVRRAWNSTLENDMQVNHWRGITAQDGIKHIMKKMFGQKSCIEIKEANPTEKCNQNSDTTHKKYLAQVFAMTDKKTQEKIFLHEAEGDNALEATIFLTQDIFRHYLPDLSLLQQLKKNHEEFCAEGKEWSDIYRRILHNYHITAEESVFQICATEIHYVRLFSSSLDAENVWIGTDKMETFLTATANFLVTNLPSLSLWLHEIPLSKVSNIPSIREYPINLESVLEMLRAHIPATVSISFLDRLQEETVSPETTSFSSNPRCRITLSVLKEKGKEYSCEEQLPIPRLLLSLYVKAFHECQNMEKAKRKDIEACFQLGEIKPILIEHPPVELLRTLLWLQYGIRIHLIIEKEINSCSFTGFGVFDLEHLGMPSLENAKNLCFLSVISTNRGLHTSNVDSRCITGRCHGQSYEQCKERVVSLVLRELFPELSQVEKFRINEISEGSKSFFPMSNSASQLKNMRDAAKEQFGDFLHESFIEKANKKRLFLHKLNEKPLVSFEYRGKKLPPLLDAYRTLFRTFNQSSTRQRLIAMEANLIKSDVSRSYPNALYFAQHLVEKELGLNAKPITKFDPLVGLWNIEIGLFLEENCVHREPMGMYQDLNEGINFSLKEFCFKNFQKRYQQTSQKFFSVRACNYFPLEHPNQIYGALHPSYDFPEPVQQCTLTTLLTYLSTHLKEPVTLVVTKKEEEEIYEASVIRASENRKEPDPRESQESKEEMTTSKVVTYSASSPLLSILQLFIAIIQDENLKPPLYLEQIVHRQNMYITTLSDLSNFLLRNLGLRLGLRVPDAGTDATLLNARCSQLRVEFYASGINHHIFLGTLEQKPSMSLNLLVENFCQQHCPKKLYTSTPRKHALPLQPSLDLPEGRTPNTLQLLRAGVEAGYGFVPQEEIGMSTWSIVHVLLKNNNGEIICQHHSRSVIYSIMESYGNLLKKNSLGMKIFQQKEKKHVYAPSKAQSTNYYELLKYVVQYETGLDVHVREKHGVNSQVPQVQISFSACNHSVPGSEIILGIGTHTDRIEASCSAALISLYTHFPLYYEKHRLKLVPVGDENSE